ncbi:MAG: RpiB/LacA/LacB family sugar-phosphate isomerase [Gammaproteobacteria bacterium]
MQKSKMIAVVSDEHYSVNDFVIDWLEKHGYKAIVFGALKTHQDEPWVTATAEAAQYISDGHADEGIFFCWSGTGSSMVANRFPTIRAALCTDAETARAGRVWNHANVLVLSNRLLSQDLAKEILNAWFEDYDHSKGAEQVMALASLDI